MEEGPGRSRKRAIGEEFIWGQKNNTTPSLYWLRVEDKYLEINSKLQIKEEIKAINQIKMSAKELHIDHDTRDQNGSASVAAAPARLKVPKKKSDHVHVW